MRDYCFFFLNNVRWEKCRKNGNIIVVPVYKKGDKQKVEKYREISLLIVCFKLYSKI